MPDPGDLDASVAESLSRNSGHCESLKSRGRFLRVENKRGGDDAFRVACSALYTAESGGGGSTNLDVVSHVLNADVTVEV